MPRTVGLQGQLRCVKELCTEQNEGGACGATSDCGGTLRCIDSKCTTPFAPASRVDELKLDDGKLHPFLGLTFAGGFDTIGLTGNGTNGASNNFATFDGAFLFALDVGVFIGNHQLLFEFAPSASYVYDGADNQEFAASAPVFEMTASYAYFVPLATSGAVHVYYPLRFGAGTMVGGSSTDGLVFLQLRADLIGAAIQVGHVLIDLHLPSFRYNITDTSGTQVHVLDWLFGTSLSYVF